MREPAQAGRRARGTEVGIEARLREAAPGRARAVATILYDGGVAATLVCDFVAVDGHGESERAAAAAALPAQAAVVFLAIGRQSLDGFAGLPHRWVLRLVDPAPQPLPRATVIVDRGPFTVAGDLALMRDHGVTHVVAKNAGGTGAAAKLEAARALGLPVVMIDRPALPQPEVAASPAEVMGWLHRATPRGV